MDLVLLLILILPWKILFRFSLIISSIFAVSASSWFIAWIGLEINVLSLLALFLYEKSPRNSEATLKYFLIQALASSMLVFFSFLRIVFSVSSFSFSLTTLITIRLLIKLGASPFHVWVPQVVEGLSWFNVFIVLTWQKLAPFLLVFYSSASSYKAAVFVCIVLSAIIGSVRGLAYTSIRKILSFSSINHLRWMLSGGLIKISIWRSYFVVYSFLLIMIINILWKFNLNLSSNNWLSMENSNLLVFASILLSFGGLPPFLGFLPKWLIISELIQHRRSISLAIILVISSLVTLFFYIRIAFPAFTLYKKSTTMWKPYQQIIKTRAAINLSGLILWPLCFMFT